MIAKTEVGTRLNGGSSDLREIANSPSRCRSATGPPMDTSHCSQAELENRVKSQSAFLSRSDSCETFTTVPATGWPIIA